MPKGHVSRSRALTGLVAAGVAVFAAGLPGASITFAQAAASGLPDRTPSEDVIAQRMAAEARAQARATSAARAQRLRSRTAYRGLRGPEARLLAKQAFPVIFRQKAFRAHAARDGERVEQYVGEHGALVRTTTGRRALVRSVLPLRAPDADGDLAPVDTSFVERDGSFELRNPLAEVRVAGDVAKGLRFPGVGLSVSPDVSGDAAAQEAPATAVGQTLTWQDVAPDTDFSVAPTPTGAQTFHLLRSQDSPEQLDLAVGVPAGARLEAVGTAGAVRVVRDGRELAAFAPPVASAADGEPVPVTLAVTDDGLRLTVAHHGRDIAYPVLVDPTVTINQHDWSTNSGVSVKGWDFFDSMGNPQLYRTFAVDGLRGLITRNVPNSWLPDGLWGLWRHHAPGDTYVQYAEFHGMQWHDNGASMCLEQGMWLAGGGWASAMWSDYAGNFGGAPFRHCYGTALNFSLRYATSYPDRGNAIVSRMIAAGTGHRGGSNLSYIPAALVSIVDDQPPTVTAGPQKGWTKEPQPSVTLSASDGGFGLANIVVDRVFHDVTTGRDGARQVAEYSSGCSWLVLESTANGITRCPTTLSGTYAFADLVDGSREGRIVYNVRAHDAVANVFSAPAQIVSKVDTRPPAKIEVSGVMPDGRYDRLVRVDVKAEDGSNAPGGIHGSGVSSARLFVDGSPASEHMDGEQTVSLGACPPDSCSIDTSRHSAVPSGYLTLDPKALSAGSHRIQVQVTDHANNVGTSAAITVTTAPNDGLDPALVQTSTPPAQWVDLESLPVTAQVTDVTAGVHHVDLVEPLPGTATRTKTHRTTAKAYGQDVPCGGSTDTACPPSDTARFTVNTVELREGVSEPTLEAFDAGGRSSGKHPWRGLLGLGRLKIDRTPPTIEPAGDFAGYGPAGKVLTEDRTYTLTIRATDGSSASDAERRSGVDAMSFELAEDIGYGASPNFNEIDNDVRVTGPRVNGACPPNPDACPQERSFTFDAGDLGEGLHALRVTARDELADAYPQRQAQHVSTRTILFYVDFNDPTLHPTPVEHRPPLTTWLRGGMQSVAVSADDAGTGIADFQLTRPTPGGTTAVDAFPRRRGDGTLACRVSDQLANRCAPSVTRASEAAATYDVAQLPEGRDLRLELRARDGVPRIPRQSAPVEWRVNVDRTAPPAATALDGTVDAAGNAAITWNPSSDPPLGSGGAGSGFAGYEVRYVVPGKSMVTAGLATPLLEFTGAGQGQRIGIVIIARDVAGNASTVSTSVVLRLIDTESDPVQRQFDRVFTYDQPPQPGDFGPAGWGPCEPDELGGSYCGENDSGDPELDALDEESSSPGDPRARAAARRPAYGLSDQSTISDRLTLGVNPYADARFKALGITKVRRIVPWNIVTLAQSQARRASTRTGRVVGPAQCAQPACARLRDLNEWMQEIRRQGNLEPLISFGTNFDQVPRGKTPAATEGPEPGTGYRNAVVAFRSYYAELRDGNSEAWPRLKLFTAWNEPEISSTSPRDVADPTTGPRKAAAYFRQLAAVCGDEGLGKSSGRCRVIAGDMTDSDATRNGYFTAYKAALKQRPRIFGFHGYGCRNATGDDILRDLARATASGDSRPDPRIWITEAGGRLDTNRFRTPNPDVNQPPGDYETAIAAANKDLSYVLNECWKVTSRLSRIYVYQWAGDKDPDGPDPDIASDRDPRTNLARFGFDSGLTDVYTPVGSADSRYASRPLYQTLLTATGGGE